MTVRPLVVAHRGASLAEPEHTADAVRRAIDDGADGVECDIRLTADRIPVLLHDATLDRTTTGTGRVSRWRWADLGVLDAGNGSPPLALGELLGLLLAAPRRVGLLIESKHPSRFAGGVERAVVAALRAALGASLDRTPLPFLAVMSFSPLAVARLARLAPELTRVQLRDARVLAPVLTRPHASGLDIRLLRSSPDAVASRRRRGHQVYVWTVDDPDDVALCLDLGVDAIITNDPAGVRAVVDASW